MNTHSTRYLLSTLLIFTALSGCSMKDRSNLVGVNIALPGQHTQQSFPGSTLFSQSFGSGIVNKGVNTSTNLGSPATCYALNITGPGIGIDPRFGCTLPSQGMGMVSGMVPLTGGTISADVPAGASRTIQLVELQSSVGCESFSDFFANGGTSDGLSTPILLGSTTIDLFGDSTVNITADFNSTTQLFQGCGGGNGGGKTLSVQSVGNSNYVQQSTGTAYTFNGINYNHGYCAPLDIIANNASTSDLAGLSFQVNVNKASNLQLYSGDSTCGSASQLNTGNTLTFPSGQNSLRIYALTTAPQLSTFELQITTSSTAFATPATDFTVVANRLNIDTPTASTAIGSTTTPVCAPIVYDQAAPTGSPSNLNGETFKLVFYNNANNGSSSTKTLPSLKVYRDLSSCNAGSSPITFTSDTNNGSVSADVTFTSQSCSSQTCTLYVSDTVAESVSPQIYSSTVSPTQIQPAVSGMSFLPFQVNFSTSTQGLTCGANGTCTYQIGFDVGGSAINLVLINGQTCGISSQTEAQITCALPANPAGNYEVTLKLADGSQFDSGLNVNYSIFNGGDGSLANPYLVASAAQFQAIGNYPGFNFKQVSAIDLSGIPSASDPFYIGNFSGTYDGGGNTLDHVSYGLFQTCSATATIQNLNLTNINVTTGQSASFGTICGSTSGGTYQNIVLASGSISTTSTIIPTGGMFGSFTGTLTNSISKIDVSAAGPQVGGMIGKASGATITHSWVTGNVTGTLAAASAHVGGFVADLTNSSSITQTFSRGVTTAGTGSWTGGLVALLDTSVISNSFALGNVMGGTYVGGLLGFANGGSAPSILLSFSLGDVAGDATGSFVGGLLGYASTVLTIDSSYARAKNLSGATLNSFAGISGNTTLNAANFTHCAAYTDTASVGNTSSVVLISSASLLSAGASPYNFTTTANQWDVRTGGSSEDNSIVLVWACSATSPSPLADDGFSCQ